MPTDRERYRDIRRVLIKVLALNWLVALAKILYGLSTRSTSMAADGLHSLSDGTSNIIGLIGIRLAGQPTDSDHPYGHKKYETFFSLGIAVLLWFIAFNLFKQAILRIQHPITPKVNLTSFLVMLVTLVINVLVMRYEQKRGKALHSDILIADAKHTRADIFTSWTVIVALTAAKLNFPILDPLATLVISLFIAYTGYSIAKESSAVLCDSAAILDVKKIVDIVLKVPGVKTCHKIRTRGRPDDIYVDLHVQVSPDMPIGEAHRISYCIEESIKKDIPAVTDVVVHMEPSR